MPKSRQFDIGGKTLAELQVLMAQTIKKLRAGELTSTEARSMTLAAERRIRQVRKKLKEERGGRNDRAVPR